MVKLVSRSTTYRNRKELPAGRLLRSLLLIGCLSAASVVVHADSKDGKVFYRYTNQEGIKVLEDKIPPEYAQKGYEILNASGDVLQVVGAAPSSEEAEELQRQRAVKDALAKWDAELLRRYSTVRDIDAAKRRKLGQVQTSIDILKTKVRGIKSQIADEQAKAADAERLGKEVPGTVLNSLAALETELKLTEGQLAQRHNQYAEVDEKYENDKERFRIIRPEKR